MVALKTFSVWSPMSKAPDPQAAYRAGLRGEIEPLTIMQDASKSGLAEAPAEFVHGACEAVMLEQKRVPGLAHWRDAFETGRAMRAIAKLLDSANAPSSVALQFRDNLTGALMTNKLRKRSGRWGAEDTVSMVMELYERVLGVDDTKAILVRQRILAYARQQIKHLPGEARRTKD